MGEPIEIELGPNGELPPGFNYVDHARKVSFREFLAANGDTLRPGDAPECWVAWYLDATVHGDGTDTWDVNSGPIEDEWPGSRAGH